MLTPAQQHFNRVMAERRHASREPSQLEMTAYETMLHRLRLDKARLSRVQSQKAKANLKTRNCCRTTSRGSKAYLRQIPASLTTC
ncbi:hypothetical protein [Klebsiella pneumoniae]|uniref:hypothetical protein n=1 Tax=Klebsiella pneumoniae TaxID=573 RepID=UPI0031BB0DA6